MKLTADKARVVEDVSPQKRVQFGIIEHVITHRHTSFELEHDGVNTIGMNVDSLLHVARERGEIVRSIEVEIPVEFWSK